MVALAWVTSIESTSGLKAVKLMERTNYSLIKKTISLTPTQKDFSVFLECRNISKVFHKSTMQPVTVIYEKTEGMWHFGVLLDANFVKRIAMILEWNGDVDNDGIPRYSHMEKEDFFGGGWKNHFRVKMISQPKEFKYVNLVRGMVPFDSIFRERLGIDGRYCASVLEPDKHPIPPHSSSSIFKIPDSHKQEPLLRKDVSIYPTKLIHIRKRARSRARTTGPSMPPWMVTPRCAYNTAWETYYVLDTETRKTVESRIKHLLAIPIINPQKKNEVKEFAYVTFASFRELTELSDLLDIPSFNVEAKKRAVTIVEFLVIEDVTKGVRFRLVEESDDMSNFQKVGEGMWYSPSSPMFVHQDIGLLLSFWLLERELHPGRLTHMFSLLLQATYARGFGSRHCTKVQGMNLFVGCHGSKMGSCTPTTPKEHVALSQYYRQHFRDMARPLLEKIICQLGYSAARFGSVGDSLYNLLCVDNELSPCRVALVTGGVTRGAQESNRVIGFCNTPHLDGTDKISGKRLAKIQEKISTGINIVKENNEVDSTLLEYANKFGKKNGFQVPTTCGYQWITKDQEHVDFYCYFINNGLKSAVRIADGVGHQFYAGSFSHHTSVCLAVVGGKVVLVDPEGSMNLFAWGKGSKKNEYPRD